MKRLKFSYKGKWIFIAVGLLIGIVSLFFTSQLAHRLRLTEQNQVEIWSFAMQNIGAFDTNEPLYRYITNSNNTIPFISVDENLRLHSANRIPRSILENPKALRRKLEQLAQVNPPLTVRTATHTFYIFYGQSNILKSLYYFPIIQIGIIAVFIIFAFIAFSSTKQDETNRIWIGMAKETAHQLGTPTSSLLGWIEYLRSQPVDPLAVEEMDKDLMRLLKVVDRFSKIGAETSFASRDIGQVVQGTVTYFRTRVPRNVELLYRQPEAPEYALINDALFEWVIENLLKNALDALQGRGTITVSVYEEEKWLNIDVTDTGKGMTKANFKRVFEPGFTTKTRGWGLGLSLSARIIERYHKGKIYVVDSELGRGTTMRVSLLRGGAQQQRARSRFRRLFNWKSEKTA
ncbi:MAG: HAMP domain-containing histidine kinase [Rikenellaceae bacterium]|jgi:signal transduction histidine kinase|nr:HAMP domain-containing histidine kinase [Rikenellaceae bacterium]